MGANGAGKSSLFEFFRFLTDATFADIPPEIIKGAIGQQVFHKPGPDRFSWSLDFEQEDKTLFRYEAQLDGPSWKLEISSEKILIIDPKTKEPNEIYSAEAESILPEKAQRQSRRLFSGLYGQPFKSNVLSSFLWELMLPWRIYSSFKINNDKIRRSIPIEQYPVLHEDAGNLSSVLFNLFSEHQAAFDELQKYIKSVIPGFRGLQVRARGGPGEVIAFWKEEGVDFDLTLADLSDGILRFICWIVLCVQPVPPSIICIDEPELGLHPRTLPLLAGLFKKASERTQIFIATHDSYFLTQFPLENITVMSKENGEVIARKPKDSKALQANLEDFGTDELEAMHRNDELEALS